MRHFLEIIEDISLILFIATILLAHYMIIRFYILRVQGKITTGYRITASVIDYAIQQTHDPKVLKTLYHCKKVYKIVIVSLIITLSLFVISSVWIERIIP